MTRLSSYIYYICTYVCACLVCLDFYLQVLKWSFSTPRRVHNSTEGEEPTKPQRQKEEQAFKVSYACVMEAEKFVQVLHTYVYVALP